MDNAKPLNLILFQFSNTRHPENWLGWLRVSISIHQIEATSNWTTTITPAGQCVNGYGRPTRYHMVTASPRQICPPSWSLCAALTLSRKRIVQRSQTRKMANDHHRVPSLATTRSMGALLVRGRVKKVFVVGHGTSGIGIQSAPVAPACISTV